MICPRCKNETNGTREGESEFCTVCGGVLGPAHTPDGSDYDQYVIVENHPSAPGLFSLRRVTRARPIGFHVAAHKNVEAVRVAIPSTHVRAPFDNTRAGFVEVWIDKRVAGGPNLPPRRCPCGDMTINDCAGECGRMEHR